MGRTKDQGGAWTREGVKQRLVARLWVRFHMSLILVACGLSAMLASWALLHAGVGSMLVRYPVAIAVAYGIFLLGVWLWLQYADPVVAGEEGTGAAPGRRRGRSLVDGGDLADIPLGSSRGGGTGGGFSGKGGGFDGGGASGAWAEGGARGAISSSSSQLNAQALAATSMQDSSTTDTTSSLASRAGGGGSKSGGGSSFSLDIDGEGLILVVLAVALVAAIVVASGYLVWAAPDILSEAAFGAVLAGGLARRARNEDAMGWVTGVVKKTWWPFAIVLALALVFAGYAGSHYPQAKTFRQAIEAATAPDVPR